MKFQTLLYTVYTRISRNNKAVQFTYLFSGNLSRPSGAWMRTNTEVCLAFPSAKPSLPRGLLRGEPPNVPKKSPTFFRKISVSKFLVYLGKTDARHEQLRYGAGWAVGPPTPPGYGTPSPPHAYVAYEREIPRRCLSKSHTRTRK